MSQVPTRKSYISINVLTGIAIPQPDSSPTAHQCLGNENIEKNGDGHLWKWCKIINVNNKFIKKNIIHNLRKSCCFVAQNGLISPLAPLDTIN